MGVGVLEAEEEELLSDLTCSLELLQILFTAFWAKIRGCTPPLTCQSSDVICSSSISFTFKPS